LGRHKKRQGTLERELGFSWTVFKTISQANNVAIIFAVISFYVLDFALNGLQASLRNLLLDIAPPNQLNAGNAWHSRMTNAGNIIGYGFGESENPAGPRAKLI
jgi:hypothetical protein